MSIKSKTIAQIKKALSGKVQVSLLMAVILFSCKDKPLYPGPLSPEESMKTFHFAARFQSRNICHRTFGN